MKHLTVRNVPQTIGRALEAEKRRLYEEIRNYPTPIAGCDQQFNYLLEQQARIVAELNRIRASTEGR